MKTPAVSVVLTSYNHERFIGHAIDSVLSQTFGDFELIVYDDNSSDASWDIIQSYRDARIKPVRNEQNRRQKPINAVLRSGLVQGNLVAIHHSDDLWLPTKLARQVAALEDRPELGAVFTQAEPIDEGGSPLAAGDHNYAAVFEQDNQPRHAWLRQFLTRGNGLCHPSALVRKSTYDRLGYYRESLFQLADFEMWIRLCARFDIHVVQEKLTRFRLLAGEANTSGDRPDARSRLALEWPLALKAFTEIEDVDLLQKAFPEVGDLQDLTNEDVPLVFALAVLAVGTLPTARMFALSLLQSALADQSRHDDIRRRFGYDMHRLYRDTGELDLLNDILLRERLSLVHAREDTIHQRELEIIELKHRIDALQKHLDIVLSSRSWTITKPLRDATEWWAARRNRR